MEVSGANSTVEAERPLSKLNVPLNVPWLILFSSLSVMSSMEELTFGYSKACEEYEAVQLINVSGSVIARNLFLRNRTALALYIESVSISTSADRTPSINVETVSLKLAFTVGVNSFTGTLYTTKETENVTTSEIALVGILVGNSVAYDT